METWRRKEVDSKLELSPRGTARGQTPSAILEGEEEDFIDTNQRGRRLMIAEVLRDFLRLDVQ